MKMFKRKKNRTNDNRQGAHRSKSQPLPPIGTVERIQALRELHEQQQETLMRPPTIEDDGDDAATFPIVLTNGYPAGRVAVDERTVLAWVDAEYPKYSRARTPTAQTGNGGDEALKRLSLQARIRILRKRADLSIEDAAGLAQMSPREWRRLEGAKRDPSLGQLPSLAAALGVNVALLVEVAELAGRN